MRDILYVYSRPDFQSSLWWPQRFCIFPSTPPIKWTHKLKKSFLFTGCNYLWTHPIVCREWRGSCDTEDITCWHIPSSSAESGGAAVTQRILPVDTSHPPLQRVKEQLWPRGYYLLTHPILLCREWRGSHNQKGNQYNAFCMHSCVI